MANEERKRHGEKRRADPNWKGPSYIFGSNLIESATNTKESYVVATMEIPWNLVKSSVRKEPIQVIYVPDMRIETMMRIVETVPDDIDMVMGIGGGSSHDCAKFIALKKNARLVQFPTILGGDAVVTSACGVRVSGKVRYIGHIISDTVYVDFDIIRKAPEDLVNYGACDILSSYTALLDWKLASERGKDCYDEAVAFTASNRLLARLFENSSEIRKLTDIGIRTIVELFQEYHVLSHKIGSDRPQEGSEHFFAYNAEYVTNRTFVHGKLLALGIWISAGFFYNRKDSIEQILQKLGMDYSLRSVGLSEHEFRSTMLTLKKFVNDGGYYYSILNEVEIDDQLIRHILTALN